MVEEPRDTSPDEDVTALLAAARQVRGNERQYRECLREYRKCLRDAFEPELKQVLEFINEIESIARERDVVELLQPFADAVELELERRLGESAWQKSKRVALRGGKAFGSWLQSDKGKQAAQTAAVIGGLLGLGWLGS